MSDPSSPLTSPRLVRPTNRRIPSGARPPPLPLGIPLASPPPSSSSHSKSASTIPLATPSSSKDFIQPRYSFKSPEARGGTSYSPVGSTAGFDSPLDALLDTEHDFTISPEGSPTLSNAVQLSKTTPIGKPQQPQPVHSSRPATPNSFSISRSSTPIQSPTSKPKPKPSRLNTTNLSAASNSTSPIKAISPGLKHWQQVRAAVLAPTPVNERPHSTYTTHSSKSVSTATKKFGIVSKAAGRFGFRHAAENVMGSDERRRSNVGIIGDFGDMTAEEREEISRERRKFARDIKGCLDACSVEESLRRLWRIGQGQQQRSVKFFDKDKSHHSASYPSSSHPHQTQNHSYNYGSQTQNKFNFDPNFSAFAPLLTELHKHLPSARAKKLWSRTCPHHDAILAELGTAFLADGTSTDGERQQALEVFGAVVKNWAPENAQEELGRWLWLCRAILTDDRQVRNRGLTLLASFLHNDPSLPQGSERPTSTQAFLSLSVALLRLLYALESSTSPSPDHTDMVNGFLADLREGDIIEVDEATLETHVGGLELSISRHQGGVGVERELFWMALGGSIENEDLAMWLLAHKARTFKRFLPSPILHATPPKILSIRAKTTITILKASTHLVGKTTRSDLVSSIWHVASEHIIPEARLIPDTDGPIATELGRFIIALELLQHDQSTISSFVTVDPFQTHEKIRGGYPVLHRDLLRQMVLDGGRWSTGLEGALEEVILTGDIGPATRMLRFFLESSELYQAGKNVISALWIRINATNPGKEAIGHFLLWLSKSHPQLFYKPLFSLAASTQTASMLTNLKTVRRLSSTIGPATFWTHVDPQMILIVLMGDVGPKEPKGKGKEGHRGVVNVRLGRYAVLVEFINSLGHVDEAAGSGTRLRDFIEIIETRLGILLASEEKESDLPGFYRSLLCNLFLTMRLTTLSVRRTSWQKRVVGWFVESIPETDRVENEQMSLLQSVYKDLSTGNPNRKNDIMTQSVAVAAPALLVCIQACFSVDDWLAMLPYLWRRCSESDPAFKAITFLVLKCGEVIPDMLAEVVNADLSSPDATIRVDALRRLASVYGWRHHILSQRVISERRGPILQFPANTLDYVQTEIGSSTWVVPHDVQDKALQKFGPGLPFELRQRLLNLGWSKDSADTDAKDWEKIPVTKLPVLEIDVATSDRPASPTRSLQRRGSNGSGHSLDGKKGRPIMSPRLVAISFQQGLRSIMDGDRKSTAISNELVNTLQRNDPQIFLRSFTEGLSVDFALSIAQLRANCATASPGFAYHALNAIVGYLKAAVKSNPSLVNYPMALSTIASLIPSVSQISLREIRKNKSEHVLLPASIHEEEGGFKLHPPWTEGQLEIQTAQLLILRKILLSNPRDVYLVKKMLSNLQIQSSLHHLPFSRAWLILVGTMFHHVNRNYNDRSELRHFLQNIANILRLHGTRDLVVTTHAMRLFILCSARFRRLFTSMGFTTIMPAVYETYEKGNPAVRDCVEYCGRSLYRIHQDSYVYQACAVIAEGTYDSSAVYGLLASLSSGNTPNSGVSSGTRGLNDLEEVEALVAMISRPEIALSEIGTSAAERQAIKLSSVTLDDDIFPRENIVKLFVTVIAANPATKRAANFLRLFTALVPHFNDTASRDLLRESVDALGSVISKGRIGDETSMLAFDPGVQDSALDWTQARREYVLLVESFAKSGGQLGPDATRRTMDMVVDLLRREPQTVGRAAANIIRELAKSHLTSGRPLLFLRDISQLFRRFIGDVDFSGLLDAITSMITNAHYDLDDEASTTIINEYVEPSIRYLASASENRTAFQVPFRSSLVRLFCATVFMDGDALGVLERCPISASLVASVVFPFCMLVEAPREINKDSRLSGIWIRLLRYVTRSLPTWDRNSILGPQDLAAAAITCLQCIKIIVIRASDAISSVKGLWAYIAQHLAQLISEGDGKFVEGEVMVNPRLIDWMMWSFFELLSLYRLPLLIPLRAKIQITLATMHQDSLSSRPSSPGLEPRLRLSSSPQAFSGRARHASRSPSIADDRLPTFAIDDLPGHARMPSQHLSPILGHHTRMPSFGQVSPSAVPTSPQARPSFSELSARRASRPVLDVSPGKVRPNFRFPSTAQARSLGGEKGAIVHLLGAPAQILSATSGGFPTMAPRGVRGSAVDGASSALSDIRLVDANLVAQSRKAVKKVQMVFGYEVDVDEEDDPVRTWSAHEALHVVAEQTKIFVENEFKNVFNPVVTADSQLVSELAEEEKGYDPDPKVEDYDEDYAIPVLSISST